MTQAKAHIPDKDELKILQADLETHGCPEEHDTCKFLATWLPEVLVITLLSLCFIERVHQNGSWRESNTSRHTLIMNISSFRDEEAILNTAKAKGTYTTKGWVLIQIFKIDLFHNGLESIQFTFKSI